MATTRYLRESALLGLAALLLSAGSAQAQTILRASHQWPGGTGDVRDEMVQIVAREVAAADVGLEIRIYPGQSL
ncbi:MAG TPA: ABC transporter substrate-binding protein, partial [Gammaproteobacteria bacterium]